MYKVRVYDVIGVRCICNVGVTVYNMVFYSDVC